MPPPSSAISFAAGSVVGRGAAGPSGTKSQVSFATTVKQSRVGRVRHGKTAAERGGALASRIPSGVTGRVGAFRGAWDISRGVLGRSAGGRGSVRRGAEPREGRANGSVKVRGESSSSVLRVWSKRPVRGAGLASMGGKAE